MRPGARWLLRAGLALVVALVLLAVLLPSHQLARLRVQCPWFNRPMMWAESVHSFDMVHVLLFCGLGLVAGLAVPRLGYWRLAMWVAVFSGVTELVQIWVPGRHPRWSDFTVDLVAGMVGLSAALIVVVMARWATNLRWGRPRVNEGGTGAWIAACLSVGAVAQSRVVVPIDADAAVAEARAQGVVSLVHARLTAPDAPASLPTALHEAFATAARAEAAQSLALLGECRRVSATLAAAGIPAIWLKGMAVAQWLYPTPGLRDVADADLLFASYEDAMRAATVLAAEGYRLPNPHVAGDLVVNELLAVSRTGRELDLHWALGNGPLFARRLGWEELCAEAIALPGLGEGALGLSPVHAFLHAAMHRVANELVGQGDRLRWLYDLHLMALRFDTGTWQRMVALAIDRGLADTCHLTLERVKAVLATTVPMGVVCDLARAAVNEPVQCRRLGAWHYRQWSNWQALPTLGQRLHWARQLLVPDMAHLQVRYGGDGAGSVRLVARRLLDGWRRVRRYTWTARRQP